MTALREIQTAFLNDIYLGTRTSAGFLNTETAHAARIDIYRNNAIYALGDVLANAYPVVQKIVGEAFFSALARQYVQVYPLRQGNRHEYGGEFAGFLQGFTPAEALPYLSDVAALEWAYYQAEIAQDAVVLRFETLSAQIAANADYGLALHPSVRILEQKHNALAIWQAQQKAAPDTVQLVMEAQTILVWRAANDEVLLKKTSAAFAQLLQCCEQALPFGVAMATVQDSVCDSADFQKEFAEALALGVFIV